MSLRLKLDWSAAQRDLRLDRAKPLTDEQKAERRAKDLARCQDLMASLRGGR